MVELREAAQPDWPEPYLQTPFNVNASGFAPVMAGWIYSQADIAEHGVEFHGAIDWALPIGTPVLAAADGYAVAFWDERWLTVETEHGTVPRKHEGLSMTFGQGLTVQIWHGKGRYTQYGHLSALPQDEGRDPRIPFYESVPDADGNYFPHTIRNALVREYRDVKVARLVKAGEVIGFVGTTGGSLGSMGYPSWYARRGNLMKRPVEPPTYVTPQLHFVEFRRRLRSRIAERRDPFGLYTTAGQYSPDTRKWSDRQAGQKYPSLWLPVAV